MKTHKEILIQAKEYAESIGNEDGTSAYDYVMGYKKCQQDMVEKYTEQDMIKFAFDTYYQEDMAKKYTEDNIKEAAYFFVSKKLAANQGVLDEEIQDFINSLNKQD